MSLLILEALLWVETHHLQFWDAYLGNGTTEPEAHLAVGEPSLNQPSGAAKC